MFYVPVMRVAMGSGIMITAEVASSTSTEVRTLESKHRFRNLKGAVQAKYKKAVIKVEKKVKAITASEVHAGLTKRHHAVDLDVNTRLTSIEAQLSTEEALRTCAERKQLEAEQRVEALTREVQAAKGNTTTAEAARASAEQQKTQVAEGLLTCKHEYRDTIVEVDAAGEQWTTMQKRCETLENERHGLEAECDTTQKALEVTRQQLAESEKKRAAEETTRFDAISHRNTAEYAEVQAQRDLAAAEKKYEGLSNDYDKLVTKYETLENLHNRLKPAASAKIRALEAEKADLQKRLDQSEEKRAGLEQRFDEMEDKKLDLEEENGDLKSKLSIEKGKSCNLESDVSTTQRNVARAVQNGLAEHERANGLREVLDEQKLKTSSLEAQLFNKRQEVALLMCENKQSISTIKQILPSDMPVTDNASLDHLTEVVIEHHRSLIEKTNTAQASLEDFKKDFKLHEDLTRQAVDNANKKAYEAASMSQQTSILQQKLKIAQQDAARLPKLQFNHDKHFNAAKQLHSELNAKKASLDNYCKLVNDQNVQISELKKDIAELKNKTGRDESEAMKKLKGELDQAKYGLQVAQIEMGQAKEMAAAAANEVGGLE